MAVNVDRRAAFDDDEKGEIARAIEQGVFLVFHPSGTVWRFKGGTVSGGTFIPLKDARTSVQEMLNDFGVSDDKTSL